MVSCLPLHCTLQEWTCQFLATTTILSNFSFRQKTAPLTEVRFFAEMFYFKRLGAGLPGVEVFILFRGEGVDTNAHGEQFDPGNLFVQFRG